MEHGKKRVSLELTMEAKDELRMSRYLEATGRKKVPWVRQLILRELEAMDRISSGSTQVDLEAMRGLGGRV